MHGKQTVTRPVICCVLSAGMSDFGITTWAQQPYSHDFAVGSNRPRKVISVDAMDAAADWPTRIEELRFDPQDVSDPTWHRYMNKLVVPALCMGHAHCRQADCLWQALVAAQ